MTDTEEFEMQLVGGVWLPTHEVHMAEWMRKHDVAIDGRLTYQYEKLLEAMKWVKRAATAVDIGAHCGLWSMHLARLFKTLHAFEPVAAHRGCFRRNLSGRGNWSMHGGALGEHPGYVNVIVTPGSSGDTRIEGGEGDIPMWVLDDMALDEVDFIKADCNGYELPALRGAEQTLLRCRPCVSVEQKDKCTRFQDQPDRGAIGYLESLGARVRHEHGGVYVLSWD